MHLMQPVITYSLSSNWILIHKKRDLKFEIDLPNSIFETLLDNNIIPDPFLNQNEKKVKWVYESEWIYEKQFEIPQDITKYHHIYINFNGIDTIAEIELNGNKISESTNMFCQMRNDITQYLQQMNKIRIIIKNPVEYVQTLISQYGNLHNHMDTIPGVAHIRKAQYHFGWDWGLKIPDIGIWKSIEIEAIDLLQIESTYLYSEIQFQENSQPNINNAKSANIIFSINLISPSFKTIEEQYDLENLYYLVEIVNPQGEVTTHNVSISSLKQHFSILIENPKLWWPHNYGTPSLYKIHISLQKKK